MTLEHMPLWPNYFNSSDSAATFFSQYWFISVSEARNEAWGTRPAWSYCILFDTCDTLFHLCLPMRGPWS